MADEGLDTTPQEREINYSKDSYTPCLVQGEDQMLKKAKRPPPNDEKEKRYRGNHDYDEVINEEGTDDNDNDGGFQRELSIKKKLIYTETPFLELENNDDSGSHVQLNKMEVKRLIKKNDIKVKSAPVPDYEGCLNEVLPKENDERVASVTNGWTKNDEITILKGLVKLKTEKGIKSKKLDYVALCESIKQSLDHESATEIHLQKKLKCLREKYKKNLKRERTSSSPHEEELFYLSHKIWGDVNKDLEINQQFTRQSITTSSSVTHYESLDPQALDQILVGDLGLAITGIIRKQSNPVQVALEQYKLVSQSLIARKNYGNQMLEVWITSKKEELSELEEEKIARSYFDTKTQHARLVSDAYNAIYGFATDCGLKEDTPMAMNEGNCTPATIGCAKLITGGPSKTSPKSATEMRHSQEREKKKKRKMETHENHCDLSIPSQLPVAISKEINESETSSKIADGMKNSLLNIATDCGLKEDTPKAMNEGNCTPATFGCGKLISGGPSNTSPKSATEMCHSQERKKKKKENHCDLSIPSPSELVVGSSKERKKKKKRKMEMQENPCDSSILSQLAVGSTKERKEKKKRKMEMQENHCDSSIPSQLVVASFMERKKEKKENHCDLSIPSQLVVASSKERKKKKKENHCDLSIPSKLAVGSSKEINESETSSKIPDEMSVEMLVKGKQDGKVASPGMQVKIYFIATLRDTGCIVGSNINDGAPYEFRLGEGKLSKAVNVGIEGMHVGEKRRLTIPTYLGRKSKTKTSNPWIQYDIELVDICE